MSPSLNPDEFTLTNNETEPKELREQNDRANAQDDAPPLGKRYDVGSGRRLMLHHAGTGTPVVVIEAGAGAFGLDYLNLFELCSKRTTCVLYDRAGSGWSDPVQGSRSGREIVTDLHDALSQAFIEGSYLLVGHSLGGLLVRAFAQNFPDEVVGLVLIDPATESFPLPQEGDEAVVQAMLSELRRNPAIAREWYPTLFAEWEKLPAQVHDPLIARHMDPDYAIVGLRDIQNAQRIQEEVANGPALPDIPVTVLTGMQIDPMPGASDEDKHAFNQVKLKAHATFASFVPQGEHRVLQDAGHLFYTQRPDVVAQTWSPRQCSTSSTGLPEALVITDLDEWFIHKSSASLCVSRWLIGPNTEPECRLHAARRGAALPSREARPGPAARFLPHLPLA